MQLERNRCRRWEDGKGILLFPPQGAAPKGIWGFLTDVDTEVLSQGASSGEGLFCPHPSIS